MARPERFFEWREIVGQGRSEPGCVTHDRLRCVFGFYAIAAAVILGRAAWLEVSDGQNFRRVAIAPITRTLVLPARRGKILARDGTVLAEDRTVKSLAV